jgi:hypothetical protein
VGAEASLTRAYSGSCLPPRCSTSCGMVRSQGGGMLSTEWGCLSHWMKLTYVS